MTCNNINYKEFEDAKGVIRMYTYNTLIIG